MTTEGGLDVFRSECRDCGAEIIEARPKTAKPQDLRVRCADCLAFIFGDVRIVKREEIH